MPGPFEELDMAEADHAAWVKAQRDPALWHQAAMAALAYRGDHHGFARRRHHSSLSFAQPPCIAPGRYAPAPRSRSYGAVCFAGQHGDSSLRKMFRAETTVDYYDREPF